MNAYAGTVDIIESIADRRIRAARAAGLFDNLAGKGRPIADIDTERPPGWWADRVVREERSILEVEDRDRDLRSIRRVGRTTGG